MLATFIREEFFEHFTPGVRSPACLFRHGLRRKGYRFYPWKFCRSVDQYFQADLKVKDGLTWGAGNVLGFKGNGSIDCKWWYSCWRS